MRQKYKIWNNTRKEWYKPIYDGTNGKIDDITLTPSGEFVRRTIDNTIHESVFTEEFTMVPYVGVNDCNGKPIYLGDKIKLTSNSYSEKLGKCDAEFIVTVEYCSIKASYIIRCKSRYNPNNLLEWGFNDRDFNGALFRKEIIGNIYEYNLLLK